LVSGTGDVRRLGTGGVVFRGTSGAGDTGFDVFHEAVDDVAPEGTAPDWAVLDGRLAATTAVQPLPGTPAGGRGDGAYDGRGFWSAGDARRSASLPSPESFAESSGSGIRVSMRRKTCMLLCERQL